MRRLLIVFTLAAAAPAMAQDSSTKPEVVDESGAICRDLNEDALPRLERFRQSRTRRAAVRNGRQFVRTSRPYVRDLADLKPDAGRRYDRFVNNTSTALDWLREYLDALAARRFRLAERRADKIGDAASRARQAAKRYGLKRSCIRFVS